MRYRQSNRLVHEAMRRHNERLRRPGRWSGQHVVGLRGGGREPPDLHEETVRFWWEPPERLREESETNAPFGPRTVVVDGELWWTYSPDWGATSNAEIDEGERPNYWAGGGERFRPLLEPSWTLASLRFAEVEADGNLLRVGARPRDDAEDGRLPVHLPFASGADAYELLVDGELGVLRRFVALLGGEEISVTELDELALDEEFPQETFVFVPPPGEEVRSPENVHRPQVTLEQAAAAAPFRLFAPPELPEGMWRLNPLLHEARKRPPTPAHVVLLYHRSDGRGSLVVQQREATGEEPRFPWAGYDPPESEEVERGGVRYTVVRGDTHQGGQNGVSFERERTAIQLQSQELSVEALLELAATLEPVGRGA